MQWVKNKQGFTIVELLIVVIVIAILAAITIVAYNGIQNSAKASAAQSGAAQLAKKVAVWQVDNPGQSPDAATFASFTNSNGSGVTYQYTQGASGAFCVTATSSNVSYFTSGTGTPVAGGCPGHGQNGVAAITNWATNPSAVGVTTGFGLAGGGAATYTSSISGVQFHHGTTSLRRDITGSGQIGASAQTPPGAGRPTVTVGQTFSWSLWVYSTKAGNMTAHCDGSKVSDASYAGMAGGSTAIPVNTWTKISATASPVADMYITQCGAYGLTVVNGDSIWLDEYMLSSGAAAVYADGSSTNWLWSGTANASISYGPPF